MLRLKLLLALLLISTIGFTQIVWTPIRGNNNYLGYAKFNKTIYFADGTTLTAANIAQFKEAYSWGNHRLMGYLSEIPTGDGDSLFIISPAHDISASNITNWNIAYGWGNHAGLYTPASHIGATGVVHGIATTSVNGFMSALDKIKLDGISAGANLYIHPNHTGDITSLGDGTTTIGNNKVTYAKIQTIGGTSRLLGSSSTTTALQEIILGTGLSMSGNTLNATATGSGSVTTLSISSVNGFAGTVATATTTPVISLRTSITGILKGNGTSLLAAYPGTDYVIPSGSITGTAGNVTGVVAVENGGTGVTTKLTLLVAVEQMLAGQPTYADNATAKTALGTGKLYKRSTGEIAVTY